MAPKRKINTIQEDEDPMTIKLNEKMRNYHEKI